MIDKETRKEKWLNKVELKFNQKYINHTLSSSALKMFCPSPTIRSNSTQRYQKNTEKKMLLKML